MDDIKINFNNPEEPSYEGVQNIKWVKKLEMLNEFPNQPERSKREDCKCHVLKRYTMSGIYLGKYHKCRCGALNTVVTS